MTQIKDVEKVGNKSSKENSNTLSKRHDALFKKVYTNPNAALQLFKEYLPKDVLKKVNLKTIKVEPESYVEDDGKQKFSDIVYSIKLKDNKKAFLYVITEHQSTSDYFMALRLLKYMILLWERHKHKQDKLPIVIPIVVYNGKGPYKAPRTLWQLFEYQDLAQRLFNNGYTLIDLQSMDDSDIKKIDHIGMVMFIMKHAHARDIITVLKRLISEFSEHLKIDLKSDNIYFYPLMWYIYGNIEAKDKSELKKIITNHLENEGEEFMTSLAQSYIDEGIKKGRQEGRQKGIQEVARNLIKQGMDISYISQATNLSISDIQKLKKPLKK